MTQQPQVPLVPTAPAPPAGSAPDAAPPAGSVPDAVPAPSASADPGSGLVPETWQTSAFWSTVLVHCVAGAVALAALFGRDEDLSAVEALVPILALAISFTVHVVCLHAHTRRSQQRVRTLVAQVERMAALERRLAKAEPALNEAVQALRSRPGTVSLPPASTPSSAAPTPTVPAS